MKKFLFLFLMAASLVLGGCSGLFGSVSENDDDDSSSSGNLKIKVADIQASRTILPTAFGLDSGLVFKLSGKSSNGTEITNKKVDVDGNGKAEVSLSNALWELTLIAYKGSDAVLRGLASADLRNGGDSVTFVMRPWGDTPGTVKLETEVWTSDAVSSGTVGIYDYTTGKEIFVDDITADELAAKKITYTKGNLDAGEYNVKIYLKNSDDEIIGFWNDLLVIDQGNISEKKGIVIRALAKPDAPTNFKATLVDNTASFAAVTYKDDGTDGAPSTYNVKFTWEDNSDNEDSFVIVLREYDAAGTEIPYDGKPYKTYDYKSISDETYKSGGLVCNRTEFIASVPTGRLFKAEIYAKNAAGDSRTGAAGSEVGLACVNDTTYFGTYLNQHYVQFALNDGTLATSGTANFVGDYYNLIDYYGNDEPKWLSINAYNAESPTYPCLYRGDVTEADFQGYTDFSGWTNNAITDSTVTRTAETDWVTKYTGYKNVTFQANYGTTPITVKIAPRNDINTARMTLKWGNAKTGTEASSFEAISGGIEINEGWVAFKVEFDGALQDETGDGRKFDKFKVEYGLSATGSHRTTNEIDISSATGNKDEIVFNNTENALADGWNYVIVYATDTAGATYSIRQDFNIKTVATGTNP